MEGTAGSAQWTTKLESDAPILATTAAGTSRKRRAYYNEIDPFACGWLRNLIAAGLIAEGDVDG